MPDTADIVAFFVGQALAWLTLGVLWLAVAISYLRLDR